MESPSIDRIAFRRRLRRLLLLPFVLMATLLGVMLWQALSLQALERHVRHIDEFVSTTAQLQGALHALENALDADLDAPSPKFARTYPHLRADAMRLLGALAAARDTTPERTAQVAETRALFSRWDRVVAERLVADEATAAGSSALARAAAGVEAKGAMELLLPRLAQLRRAEWRRREQIVQHSQHATRVVVGSGVAIAALLATALALFARRQLVAVSAEYARALETARQQTQAFERARDRGEQLLEQTRAALRLRDEFLELAAHELRTPLTPLRIQVETLARALRRTDGESGGAPAIKPDRLLAGLGAIRGSVDRLTRLVSDLLEISELRAGRLTLAPEPLDLCDAARAAASRAAPAAARAHCDLRVTAPSRAHGRWDRRRLDQVLDVLVSNALKYGPGGPVEITVERARGATARLVVRDRGIGIAREDQQRIFGMFERAVSERNYGGFGLGLWIARHVVEQMGGTIGVESELGRGASFTVELPLDPALDEQPAAEAAPARTDTAARASREPAPPPPRWTDTARERPSQDEVRT